MNWYTTSYIAKLPVHRKKELAEQDSCCEHVEADPSCATHNRCEKDSMGTVASYVCCAECNEKAEIAADEELETCHDCGQEKPMKEITLWRWYDFYAPQGDEPLPICDSCRELPKHIERVKRDREMLEEEMEGWDDD